MIKHCCDLCKEELKQGERRSKYRIKQLKKDRFENLRWVEIEAHDKCIRRVLEVNFYNNDGELDDEELLRRIKAGEPLPKIGFD